MPCSADEQADGTRADAPLYMSILLDGLNSEQRAAVVHGEGPLMIIAGAGTGKTTVITRRIAWLIEQGRAAPGNILALTFTDKAANEMEERVDRLLPMGYLDLWISTFHGFCERVLRAHGADIGLPPDFRLANEVDAWLLMRRNLDRFGLAYFRPRGSPTRFMRAMLTHFSRLKDEGIPPDAYGAYVDDMVTNAAGGAPEAFATLADETRLELEKYRELAHAYAVYEELLLEAGALDFGNLLRYTVELFRTRPNVLKTYRDQFAYIVVDEFQDTNSVQYELVKLLASPKNNLTVVGDDDQAIYKFRGAALANILTFRADFPDAKKIALVHNYRSGEAILAAAYTLIAHNNPHRLEVTEGLSKKLVAQENMPAVVRHLHAAYLEDEVEVVTKTIIDLHDAHDVPWGDMAILVRGNDHAQPFIESLARLGVPFRFLAQDGLYVKSLILDCLAWMRIVDLPQTSTAMYRVLSHPRLGLSEGDAAELLAYVRRKGGTLYRAMVSSIGAYGVSMDGRARIMETASTIRELQALAKRMPVSELFVALVKQSGLLKDVGLLAEPEQRDHYDHLNAFHARLKRFVASSKNDTSLHAFLDEFDAERDAGEAGGLAQNDEEGPDVVSVMTVHGAKGLEFAHVFVVNLVEQRFPSQSRGETLPLPPGLVPSTPELDDHISEERRLLYVAMTRAKRGLYLVSSEDYGGARAKKPSRFLAEIGIPQEAVGSFGRIEQSSNDLPEPDNSTTLQLDHSPDKISFSQLAAFDTCPQQYKYAHILHVPSFGHFQMSFGKTMHNTLQHFLERILESQSAAQASLFDGATSHARSIPSLPELYDMFDRAWIDEWYKDDAEREKYRKEGKESLAAFHAKVVSENPRPFAIEKGFTLKIGDILVKGRIDRIDYAPGAESSPTEPVVEIIDYKTGTPKSDKLDWKDRRQLIVYALAAEECFTPPLRVAKLTYYYLDNNTTVSFEPTEKDKIKLKEEILATTDAIRKSDFTATLGQHCEYCDFKDICPFRKR